MISEARLVLQNASQQDPIQSENFRGKVFVGNEEGLRYVERRVQIEQQLSLVQQRLSTLETEKYRLSLIGLMYWNLKEGSTTTRERFLSTYKRDKLSKQLNASLQGMLQVMAVTQNMTQHCTIVEDQTTLYTKNCMDSTQLYIVSTSKSTNLCIQSW